MLTEQQKKALIAQKDISETEENFVDAYELALVFFSDESSLPPNLQGLTPEELKNQLNTLSFEETDSIINQLRPRERLSEEQIASWIWIRGARDINNGEGAYADFIRGYTEQQIEFRNIEGSITPSQEISNGIARNLINDLIANGNIPPIVNVGLNDASVVTDEAANGDPAAWAGNPLFVLLGSDVFFKANLLHDNSARQELKRINPSFPIIEIEPANDTYDLLLSFKNTADLAGENPFGLFFETIREIISRPNSTREDGEEFIRNGLNAFIGQSNSFLKETYGSNITALNVLSSSVPIAGLIGGTFPNLLLGSIELNLDKLNNNNSELIAPISGIVHGADGDDRIRGKFVGNIPQPILSIIDGGSENDIADYSEVDKNLTFTIDELDETIEAEYIGEVNFFSLGGLAVSRIDSIYNVEHVIGSARNDKFEIKTFRESLQEIDAGDGEEDLLDLSEIGSSITVDAMAEILSSGEVSLTIKNFESFEGTTENDTFIANDRTARIVGGDGKDTADFSNLTSELELNLNSGFFSSDGNVSLKSIERIIATPQNDNVRGSREEEIFEGREGNDALDGGEGLDTAVFSDNFENYE